MLEKGRRIDGMVEGGESLVPLVAKSLSER
jgi:hypothetical protein